MSKFGKDSPEVIEFMILFARLKHRSDAPEQLATLAAGDSSVKELCSQLSLAAFRLKMNERRHRELFATPVDPSFLAAWRDYEERYQPNLPGWLTDEMPEAGRGEPSDASPADLQWDLANDEASEQSRGIEDAIDFAQFNADQDHRWADQEDFIERIQDGIAAWDRLKQDTGFDLRDVFRRRALIPFVLIPRQVSDKHGSAESLSMLKHLKQAHDAFVYGAHYAALALMRSIMERVLRDHYPETGGNPKKLDKLIESVREHLPANANAASLDRLRRLANAILHLDKAGGEGLPKLDEKQLEKEIIRLLYVLRALIESAK